MQIKRMREGEKTTHILSLSKTQRRREGERGIYIYIIYREREKEGGGGLTSMKDTKKMTTCRAGTAPLQASRDSFRRHSFRRA